MTTPQEVSISLDEIIDDLEKRIKSSHRDTFLPDRIPAENGEMARLARESAKDIAKQALQAREASIRDKAILEELKFIDTCPPPLIYVGIGDRIKHYEKQLEQEE